MVVNVAAAAGAGGGPPGAIGVHQPWFLGAPFSRALAIGTALLFVMFETSHLHSELALDMDRITAHGEFYRLFTCNLTFSTTAELILGLLVLTPLIRRYEREMGTAKFATYLLLSSIVAMFLELCLLSFYPTLTQNVRFSGPYPTFGAALYLYHRHAPRLHPKFFGVLGLDFSEKSLTYLFALQILLSGGWSTVQPALCGMVAGHLVSSPMLPLSKVVLPDGWFGWLDRDVPQMISARELMGGGGRRRAAAAAAGGGQRQRMAPPGGFGGGGGGFGGGGDGDLAAALAASLQQHNQQQQQPQQQQQQQPAPPPPPSEEAIMQLTAMGFEREAVIRALGQTDNNVEAAANRLLSGA